MEKHEKMKNSKIDQENEELGGQDHDFDFFWVPFSFSHGAKHSSYCFFRFLKIDYNGVDKIMIEGLAASDQDILKLISNLGNKKLISQASLDKMILPNTGSNNTRTMKGFVIECIIGWFYGFKQY